MIVVNSTTVTKIRRDIRSAQGVEARRRRSVQIGPQETDPRGSLGRSRVRHREQEDPQEEDVDFVPRDPPGPRRFPRLAACPAAEELERSNCRDRIYTPSSDTSQ